MGALEFRCCFFAKNYDASLNFYGAGLGLAVLESWDRGSDDRGTLFGAASGIIEVLSRPMRSQNDFGWGFDPPRGFMVLIEVDGVDALYRRVVERGLEVREALKNEHWGHRSFKLTDPDGVTLCCFSKIDHQV